MANQINIVITAQDKASKPLRAVKGEIEETGKSTGRFNTLLAAVSKTALVAGVAGFTALAGGMTAAATASFEQVNAVQNARFGLQAYERDASKVNDVLSDLVAYAKSDTGVLFNRKDLFAAASTLKMYGDATDDLTDHVKVLSKGVAQGKTTFQELSAIVGRAAAKGRLDAVDFDMLIERGIGLDKSFRGAKVTSEELWKALDNAIPAETLAGRADTIDGKMIRLQSAFRGVGDEILGVDPITNNFVKNGLGDRFMNAVSGATDLLKKLAPAAGTGVSAALKLYDDFIPKAKEVAKIAGDYLAPKLEAVWSIARDKLFPALERLWKQVIAPMIPVIGALALGALGGLIDALGWTLDAATPLINFLADNEGIVWALVGAFIAFKGALAIQAQITAFQTAFGLAMTATQANIATTSGVFGGLKALVAAPISMPAITVAAAIGSLMLVIEAINSVQRALDAIDTKNAAAKASAEAGIKLEAQTRARYKAGQINEAEFNRLMNIARNGNWTNQGKGGGGWAAGTNYSYGQNVLVGEHGPERVTLPQGSTVTPAYQTRQGGGSGGGVVIESLTYHVYNEMDEKRALRDLGFQLELAS